VVENVENGPNIVVPGLCLMISSRKVLADGFEDGGDSPIRLHVFSKFQKSGTKSC